MDLGLMAIVAITALVVVAGTIRLPAYWRSGGKAVEAGFRGWWPYGRTALAGWIRAIPTALFGAWAFLVALLAMMTAESIEALRGIATALAIGSSILLLLSVVLIATIVIVNRPRVVVPPGRRGEPGLLQMWISRLGR